MRGLEEDGTLIRGFLVDDMQEVCWGRLDLIESGARPFGLATWSYPQRLPDPLLLGRAQESVRYGSAYLVFHKEEPIAAFKANTREGLLEVTDFVGD